MEFPVEIRQRFLFSGTKKADLNDEEKIDEWKSTVAFALVNKHRHSWNDWKKVFDTSAAMENSYSKLQVLHFCNMLNISNNNIAAVVKQCPQLSELSLAGCVTLTDQVWFEYVDSMFYLYVSLHHLAELKNIQSLDISRCLFSDNGVKHLVKYDEWEQLHKAMMDGQSDQGHYNNKFQLASTQDFNVLGVGSTLKCLKVVLATSLYVRTHFYMFIMQIKFLPLLFLLHFVCFIYIFLCIHSLYVFFYQVFFCGDIIRYVCVWGIKKKTQMNDCPNMTDLSVRYVSHACGHRLHSLHIRAIDVDRNTLLDVCDHCKYLEELDLGSDNMYFGNDSIDDMCIFSLLALRHLRVLNLAGLHNITHKSVCPLLKSMSLKCVNLSGCSKIHIDLVCQTLYQQFSMSSSLRDNLSLSPQMRPQPSPSKLNIRNLPEIVLSKHVHHFKEADNSFKPAPLLFGPNSFNLPEIKYRAFVDPDISSSFKLCGLKLANTNISNTGVSYLKHLPIQHLDLNGCNEITNDALKDFSEENSFPKLVCLDLGLCVQLQRQKVEEFSLMRRDIRIKYY
ncbi:hypothetical protein RFI_06396 [Reticulomyxa filosa]|uniref:Uncharacterized protein n=1 Tax=Reticulomyxa filosa TaxID=46433 RepID=X6NXJ6_RETFI|nr:hypothetical protein RFI_06396 [Reticulomyxa filosa]|eukprot:ETO30721.1 hypothetical protein RFI_06396 [Reticulomyxa filosa]